MALTCYIRKQPKVFVILTGLMLTALAGIFDRITGQNFAFLLFYLIPVYFFVWFVSKRAGILIAAVCALVWIADNIGAAYQPYGSTYLNMSTELIFFFIATMLLCVLKEALGVNDGLSRTDCLTGAINRRAFYDAASYEILRAQRYKRPFTVTSMDIDNFKIINYRFGHATGDKLLKAVAGTITNNLRKVDIIARFGGDEFIILMPETGPEGAQVVLSRIRNVLLNIMEKNSWPVTFTFGTVTFVKAPSSVEEMMKKTGSVMYNAKDNGMNTVEQEVVDA